MDINNVKDYLLERSELSAAIAKGIMKSIAGKVQDLPEESWEVLGDSIFDASSEVAATILGILAADDEYDDDDDDDY